MGIPTSLVSPCPYAVDNPLLMMLCYQERPSHGQMLDVATVLRSLNTWESAGVGTETSSRKAADIMQ